MTYEQFWDESPSIVKAYRQKFYIEYNRMNESAWLTGLYVFDAFNKVLSAAFGGKREEYVNKPIDILPKTEKELKEEAEKQQRLMVEYLSNFADSWNRKSH